MASIQSSAHAEHRVENYSEEAGVQEHDIGTASASTSIVGKDSEVDSSAVQNTEASFRDYKDDWILYKRRWLIVAVFMVMNASNTWMMVSYGPISYLVGEFYNITVLEVNILSIIVMFLNLPGGLFAGWALDYFDKVKMLMVASVLNGSGSLFRILAIHTGDSGMFPMQICASILIGMSQPLMTWSPTPIAQGWFSHNERSLANSLLSLSNPLGLMFSLVISPVATNGDYTQVQTVNWIAAGPALFACAMICIGGFFTESVPPSPPSPAAAAALSGNQDKTSSTTTLFKGLKVLFTMPSYWCLMLCVGGGIGIFSSVLLMMNQILCPYGYSSTFAGPVLGPLIVIGGLVGAALGSMMVDRNKKYIIACRISYVVAGGALLLFVIGALNEWHEGILIVLALVFGVFGLPIYPIGNELACELAYPVSPVTCAGFLFMMGGIMGVVCSLMVSLLSFGRPAVDYPNQTCTSDLSSEILDSRAGMWALVVLLEILTVLSFFIKGDLKRLQAEKAGRISRGLGSASSVSLMEGSVLGSVKA